jgi:hypothetical protein
MSNSNDIKRNLLASSFATIIAEFATLPICTIKTNYQNTNSNSIINTTKELYQTNGFKSFYQAFIPAMCSQMISTSSKFVFYKYLEDKKLVKNFTGYKFINGAIAGLTSTILTHPLDNIKIHHQMNKSIVSEIKSSGIKVLYRGYSKTISKIIVSSSLFFPLYDYYLDYIKKQNIKYDYVLASGLSGFTTTLITHPIDYLKTRHIYGHANLYDSSNIFNYYKGISLNMMRIVPSFIITMSMTNIFLNNF